MRQTGRYQVSQGFHDPLYTIKESVSVSSILHTDTHTRTHAPMHTSGQSNPSYSAAGKTRLDPWPDQSNASSRIWSHRRMAFDAGDIFSTAHVKGVTRIFLCWMASVLGSCILSPASWVLALWPRISDLTLAMDDVQVSKAEGGCDGIPFRQPHLSFEVQRRIFICLNSIQNQNWDTTPTQ